MRKMFLTALVLSGAALVGCDKSFEAEQQDVQEAQQNAAENVAEEQKDVGEEQNEAAREITDEKEDVREAAEEGAAAVNEEQREADEEAREEGVVPSTTTPPVTTPATP